MTGRSKCWTSGWRSRPPKSARRRGDSDLPTEQLTREGRILGIVAYMSPEQAEGKTVDARSDIFSLGVTFYEMLTGERPFGGDTPASTLSAVIKDDPRPVNALVPSLPRDVARIVKRCLAKDPSRRYQTTIEVRNELEELAQSLDSVELMAEEFSSHASSSRRRWPLWSAVAGVGLLAALWATGVVRTPLEGLPARRSPRSRAPVKSLRRPVPRTHRRGRRMGDAGLRLQSDPLG